MQQKLSKTPPKSIAATVTMTINLSPPEVSSEAFTFAIDARQFQPKPEKKVSGEADWLIIGFDTEYVTPEDPSSRDDIRAGRAKYRVLSYQFHCLLMSGEAWSGIAVPHDAHPPAHRRWLTSARSLASQRSRCTMIRL